MHESIADIENEIVEEFELLGDDWQDKYQHIIELGKSLAPLPAEEKTDDNKVRGCQSNVWLIAKMEDNRLIMQGESDALIVKGLVALVLRVLSGHTVDEIINTPLTFIDRLGLQAHLSSTRSNGLAAMIKQIRFYAMAYKVKMNL